MKLSAILPLPDAAARQPAAVLVPILGEPVVVRVARALAAAAGDVLVVADDRLVDEVRACLDAMPAVRVLAAGAAPDTATCLAVASEHLRARAVTHVLVGDHRYPVVSSALVERVVTALADGAELAIPVLPVTDTVKVVDDQGVITSTVDRALLQVMQYPHGRTIDRLADPGVADAVPVAGDADAIALDLPADAALLEAVIACR